MCLFSCNSKQLFMSDPVLSFVVPVYNVEEYVERCLLSILTQSLEDELYEIVIQDDGSTDGSLLKVRNVLGQRHNCKVLTSENRGLSAARNSGLRAATGRYVWFVDSDDFLEAGCLRHIVEVLSHSHVDVFNTGYKKIVGGVTKQRSVPWGRFGYIQAWTHIYRREFLCVNNLRFVQGLLHEDFEFTPRASFLANKVENIDVKPYVACKRPGSITTTFNPKRAFDMVEVAISLYEFQKSHCAQGCNFNRRVALALNNALRYTLDTHWGAINECMLNQKLESNKYLLTSLFKTLIPKYLLMYVLFTLCPSNIVGTYRRMRLL